MVFAREQVFQTVLGVDSWKPKKEATATTTRLKMIVLVVLGLLGLTSGKIYDRCELARELKFVHKAPSHQLATWVCIAEHESQYNTSIVGHLGGDGSGDHGIFQISDLYWCSPPGKGYACDLSCAQLEDDDISDDFVCAQKIYKEHKQLSGDGFNAWAVYAPHCKGSKSDRYVKDCFNESESPKSLSPPATAFAHGYFDTAAGRANKDLGTGKQDRFVSLTPPSFAGSQFLFNSPKTSNRFLTSTENIDLFFTPTTAPTFIPTSRTTTFTPPTTSARSSIFFHRPTVTPPPVSSVFNFGNSFSTPSTTLFFTPTLGTGYRTSTIGQPVRPVFIINGVQWY